MLLAIDPGSYTGWALFDENILGHFLCECGLVIPARWDTLVSLASQWEPSVIIEEPTIYPHSKARPADVMALQLKVGQLKGRFEAIGCQVELVQPRTWKRQVPKPIHNIRTLKALSDAERRIAKGKRHDVIDAIGLGLWKLGRMK